MHAIATPNFEAAVNTIAIPGASKQFDIDAAQNRPLWEAGEAVLSKPYEAGSFVITPGTLESLAAELALPEGGEPYNLYTASGEWSKISSPPTPLQQFMIVAGEKLRDFVSRDMGIEPRHPGLHTTCIAGPYARTFGNTWHHDAHDKIGRRVYLATLFGPTTEYAIGDFSPADYDEDGELLRAEVPIPKVEPAKLLTINIHDKTAGLHQSPDGLDYGPRILVGCFAP